MVVKDGLHRLHHEGLLRTGIREQDAWIHDATVLTEKSRREVPHLIEMAVVIEHRLREWAVVGLDKALLVERVLDAFAEVVLGCAAPLDRRVESGCLVVTTFD